MSCVEEQVVLTSNLAKFLRHVYAAKYISCKCYVLLKPYTTIETSRPFTAEKIVQALRVDQVFLFRTDDLRCKGVFDSEDCEIVHAEKKNERKASELLDILETKATECL